MYGGRSVTIEYNKDDPVGDALELLLARWQIEFIKSWTFTGSSRKVILRQLIGMGIAAWEEKWGLAKAERERRLKFLTKRAHL